MEDPAVQQDLSFVPKPRVRQVVRRASAYPWVMTCVSIVCGLTIPLFQMLEQFMTGKWLQLALFLGLGIYHAGRTNEQMELMFQKLNRGRGSFSGLLAVVVLLALAGIYLADGEVPLVFAAASASLLLLPELVRSSWQAYIDVPETEFKPWTVPAESPDKRASISINSVTIYFRLRRDYFDLDTLNEAVTEPSRITLGRAFHQFLDQYNQANKPITLTDEKGQPFTWTFTVRTLRGATTRYVDPELSLIDNKLPNNSVITARRLRHKTDQS